MHSYLKLSKIQLKLFMREPVALFFTLAFPLLLLILFGEMFGNEPQASWGGFGYIDTEVPALVGLTIATIALMSIPIATATAREQKILRRYKATPLPPFQYFAAEVSANILIAFVGLGLLVLFGHLLYNLRVEGNLFYILLIFLLSALAFVAIGYIIASLAPTSRIAQVVGQVIFFPMMFLSGAAFPIASMPEGLQTISNFMPMTHMVKLLQETWMGSDLTMLSVAILIAMAVIGSVISVRIFRWE